MTKINIKCTYVLFLWILSKACSCESLLGKHKCQEISSASRIRDYTSTTVTRIITAMFDKCQPSDLRNEPQILQILPDPLKHKMQMYCTKLQNTKYTIIIPC